MAGMNDIIMANPMGAIQQATQTAGAMDQLSRLRTQDQTMQQDRGVAAEDRKRQLLQEAMAFAGRMAPEILSAPTPEEKNARYKQFRTLSGLQGYPIDVLPMEYSPDVERRLSMAAANIAKANAPTSKAFAPQPMVDDKGNYIGMGVPVFDPNTGQATLRPLGGGQVMSPLDIAAGRESINVQGYNQRQRIKGETEPRIAADTRAAEAGVDLATKPAITAATTTAKSEATSSAEAADELKRAQAALPGLRETVASLKELSKLATYTTTGKAFDLAAKELGFGGTKGSTARAKMVSVVDNQVLPLLRDTFGAAFTAAEGERLRDTLLDPDASPEAREAQLNAFMDQKVRDIETKQRQLGVSTQSRLAPDDQAALDWARANPNDPRAAQIMQLHGGR